jgi:eukaryotic-like serine/threonine-protein kinase
MRAERWQQIEDLYHAALERSPAERSAFIAEACDGDEELRREVESLLASHDGASQFIEEPAAEAAARLIADDQAQSRVGQEIGHYELVELIGEGGMGEVYLAEDARLGRRVALKLLPSRFTTDNARLHRFQQEACAASALNHPNILTIYEVGQSDSTHFIATEFIDGVTLRERMAGAPVELNEVLEVATQVASALSAAHTSGIVHRDVKPENIMLRRDGYVKVLDFGLAKLTEQQASSREAPTLVRSEPGLVMGTVSYMSPEQARGGAVDARTDLWSLGCVVYEMVAGRTPFAGETMTEVLAGILGDKEPPPLSRYAREVPPELDRIVTKALTRNREERYQTAKDLLVDLKRLKQRLDLEAEIQRTGTPELRTGTTETSGRRVGVETERNVASIPTSSVEYIVSEIKHHRRAALLALAALVLVAAGAAYLYFSRSDKAAINSIAVLPFVNASNNPDTEYLSDGISESLINSLSQVPQLRVVPRSTVFRYKGRDADPQTIGRELGVRAVLTGKLVQRGDTLNIQTELVDVEQGSQLWGEQYNRKLADLLAVQEEISREISQKLRIRLSGEERKQLTKRYTENTEAYQLYLKGRYYWNKRTAEGLKKGVDYFQQAIDVDPNYGLAYAGLADSYNVLPIWTPIETKDAYPKAKSAALKALEIDDSLAEAHTSLAYALYRYDWDWPAAEREFKRGIQLKPNYATAHQWYSFYLSAMGRAEEAIVEIKRAQDLEPLSLFLNTDVGFALGRARQYDQAVVQLRKTIAIDPTFGYPHFHLGLVYEQKGMYDAAIDELRKAVELSPKGAYLTLASLGHSYAVSGKRAEALEVLDQLKEKAKREHVSAYFVALIYTGLGDKDLAFVWFNKACQDRDYPITRLKDDLRFDNIRSDPRFADLLRCVGLPQ